MRIDPDDFVSAGYHLARIAERDAGRSADLLPARLISASPCICAFFPAAWAIEWAAASEEQRFEAAGQFGIAAGELPSVMQWATAEFEKSYGWPHVLYSLAQAETAAGKLHLPRRGLALFGLGLHRSWVARFLQTAKPEPPQPGYAPNGATGYYQCVLRQEPLAGRGVPLGFELLASQSGLLTCSWLCNGLERYFQETSGITPNEHGLLASLEVAGRCAERINAGEVAAEPGDWLPWLVVRYG